MDKDYEFYMSHHISEVKDMTPEDQAKYKRGQAEFDLLRKSTGTPCGFCSEMSLFEFAGMGLCSDCGVKLFDLPKDKE